MLNKEIVIWAEKKAIYMEIPDVLTWCDVKPFRTPKLKNVCQKHAGFVFISCLTLLCCRQNKHLWSSFDAGSPYFPGSVFGVRARLYP